jgi:hypothetical protein
MSRNFWLQQRQQRWYPFTASLPSNMRDAAMNVLENQTQYNESLNLNGVDATLHVPLKEVLLATSLMLSEKMSGNASWRTKEVDVSRHVHFGFAFNIQIGNYLHPDIAKRVLLSESLANSIWGRLKPLGGQGITYTFYNLLINGSTVGMAAWDGK